MSTEKKYSLIYIRGSPWSVKCLIGIALLPAEVKDNIKFNEGMTAKSLIARNVPRHLQPSIPTVPGLIYGNDNYFGDSFEVLKALAAISEQSAFAKSFLEREDEMKSWDDGAQNVLRFGRARFNENPDDVLKYLAPQCLSYIPGLTKFIMRQVVKSVKEKYYPEDSKIKNEEIMNYFQRAQDALVANHNAGRGYLCGEEMTYADVVVAMAYDSMFPSPVVNIKNTISVTYICPEARKSNDAMFNPDVNFPLVAELRDRVFADENILAMLPKCAFLLKRPPPQA